MCGTARFWRSCHEQSTAYPRWCWRYLWQVIRYCDHHKDDPSAPEDQTTAESEIVGFDADFVKVDQATLFEMILVRRSPHAVCYAKPRR